MAALNHGVPQRQRDHFITREHCEQLSIREQLATVGINDLAIAADGLGEEDTASEVLATLEDVATVGAEVPGGFALLEGVEVVGHEVVLGSWASPFELWVA